MTDKYYRLVCFVVDICADVLRKYFVKLAKTDVGNTYTSVDAYLSHRNRDVMQLFHDKKLRRYQYDLLYPVNGTADENQWDVPILVTLITKLFASRLQTLVIVALETEIGEIRNELQHHPSTSNISDEDFDDYWRRLDCSVRLIAMNALETNDQASLLEKINQVKCNHLPNVNDFLRIWHEETSKQLLNIMNEVQANAEETTSILRQVTVHKPGPSGNKNKRIKVADDILARLQVGFESLMEELSDDFNPPSEVEDIRDQLRDCHHVVVTGCNNSHYFETALAAIKGMDYNYKRCVEMHSSSDWRHIDPEEVDLVVCRNPFGKNSYDESKAKAMDDIFKSMIHSTKRGNGDKALDIVIVTDLKIMEECKMHHDHELLDEMVKVFTDTSQTQPVEIECRGQGQYAQSSPLPLIRNNLGALTEYFLKVNKINSCQVDEEILKKAKKSFQKYKAILLTGRKKSGKTSIAVALASVYKEQECLLLKKPHDIDKIDFPNICLVIIDEFAGKYRYEENEAYEWYNMFDLLYNTVVAGQLNVIITCEKGKLDKCINEIGRHAILDHVVDVPLQKAVVKSEATEQNWHAPGQIVTTDHFIGTILNSTQTENYTSSLLAEPSQEPILSTDSSSRIPESTECGDVPEEIVTTDHFIGTISNSTETENYTSLLLAEPSQEPILFPDSGSRIPESTGNTSNIECGDVPEEIVTTDHSIGTISNSTETENYISSLLTEPSQEPILSPDSGSRIPESTGNTSNIECGDVPEEKVTTDHSIGTISNSTETENYTSSLLAEPSQEPILSPDSGSRIPESTGNTSNIECGDVPEEIVTTDHSIGTISSSTETENYTSSLLAEPSQEPILSPDSGSRIPESTGNTSNIECGHVPGEIVTTDHSIGTISNSTQTENFTSSLLAERSQEPILSLDSGSRIPESTGNISIIDNGNVPGQMVTSDHSIRIISNSTQTENFTSSLLAETSQEPILSPDSASRIPESTGNTSIIECSGPGQYTLLSSLPVTRNNLGAMAKHFMMVNKISSGQVDDQILKNAKESFKANHAIVLTGPEKCGKTSIAVELASAYEEQECLLLKKPNDVNYIDFPNTCLVIIDEFAGKYRYEENEVYEWYNMFDYLYNAVIAEQMNVIITCEKGKLDKCIKEVSRHAILEHVVDVSLQKVVVRSEVPEQYGHVSEKAVTTDSGSRIPKSNGNTSIIDKIRKFFKI